MHDVFRLLDELTSFIIRNIRFVAFIMDGFEALDTFNWDGKPASIAVWTFRGVGSDHWGRNDGTGVFLENEK